MRRHTALLAALILSITYPVQAAPISSDLFLRIQLCESEGIVNRIGDDGVSVGVFQWTEETFYRLAKLARKNLVTRKLLNKQEKLNYHNVAHQLMLAHWSFEHGWGHEWTCYRKVTGTGRPNKKKLIAVQFPPMD